MSLLEEAWSQREEEVYVNIFGDVGPGIYPLTPEIFAERFGQKDIDPRWLHYGVFKCPPVGKRKTWAYVSSGMSNPWEDEEPEEYSGLGIELMLETEIELNSAILVVQNIMAFNILLSIGKYGDKPLLDFGDRIPLSMAPNLTHVMMAEPINYPKTISIKSGAVDFLQIVGITENELLYAKENGSDKLAEMLISKGIPLITIPGRSSVI